VFRVIGNWGERHVFLFRKAFIIAKKRKDGFLQVKVIIKVTSFTLLGSYMILCLFIIKLYMMYTREL